MENHEGEPLLYGSLILLSFSDYFLYSKGFIDNSFYLQKNSSENEVNMMSAVFRINPQAMYSVQDQIFWILESDRGVEIIANRIARIGEAFEAELKANVRTYKNFRGQPVRFNSLVQLEHIQTHKFLTLMPNEHAEIEKDNIRLKLEDFGSEASHFRIQPYYSFQEEVDGIVRIGDKVIFEGVISEIGKPAYISCTETHLNENPFRRILSLEMPQLNQKLSEVNASLDTKVPWLLMLFSGYGKEEVPSHLMCGDYIWLNHAEENACLSAKYTVEEQSSKFTFNLNVNDTNGL